MIGKSTAIFVLMTCSSIVFAQAPTKPAKPGARFAQCVQRGISGKYSGSNARPNDRATAEAWCRANGYDK
jgi:hypothetical protein